MSRVADYTIKGFLYQFHKTLLEVLNSPADAEVTVEGPIEDIDIETPHGITAIQCKYHETQNDFVLSHIYKPLLQMMKHFHDDPAATIKYRLYAYFPNIPPGPRSITEAELLEVLNTENATLKKQYADHLRGKIDIKAFLLRFALHFGIAYDALIDEVYKALRANDMPEGELDGLVYPNAIHLIATLSIEHDESDRKIGKTELLGRLKALRKTLITRWTLALRSHKQIMSHRKRQLVANLRLNARSRHFLISQSTVEDFDERIVTFIKDYLAKYHFKACHTSTPIFCLDCDAQTFDDIRWRLHQHGIRSADGFVGTKYDEDFLLREPLHALRGRTIVRREFQIRLVRFSPECKILNKHKCDDFFIVRNGKLCDADLKDVNDEPLAVTNLKELSFLLGLSDAYE
jgi:hypothetical protein